MINDQHLCLRILVYVIVSMNDIFINIDKVI